MTAANRLNITKPGGFWFFAYGSLMWDPPSESADIRPAQLYGYHRSFCVSSENYRGTTESPGLALGLDRGGSCTGVALYIDDASRNHAIREIEAREMNHDPIYICRPVRLTLATETVTGYALVVDRKERICAGKRGPNIDYLANTIARLDAMEIAEGHLHHLLRRATQLRGTG